MYYNINTRQDYNVKKVGKRLPPYSFNSYYPNYSLIDLFINGVLQTSGFFLGVGEASLEAVRTFNSQLINSTLRNQGYSDEYIKDIFDANAEYHDKMAQIGEQHQINTNMRFHEEK